MDESPFTGDGHLSEDTAVLAALGEDVPAAVHAHLEGCAVCRDEVGAWSRVVGAARSGEAVEPVPVPAGTWEGIARELGLDPLVPRAPSPAPVRPPGPGPSAPVVRPARRGSRGPRRTGGGRRWLPVAAAAVVGLGLGVLGTRLVTDLRAPVPAAAPPVVVSSAALEPLPGQAPGPGRGTADVTEEDGTRRLELRISGVPAPADGFLEAWLLDADGGLVSLGTLDGDGAADAMTVTLPADLDLDRFDVVDVSREPLDGDPGHSSDSVLRGTLSVGA
jgi:Anti-sigma-K factor rskA